MKKVRIIQMIELILLIVVLVILIIALTFIGKNHLQKESILFKWHGNDLSWKGKLNKTRIENKREQQILHAIEDIEINFEQADILLVPSDKEYLEIIQFNNKKVDEHYLFSMKESNGRVIIQGGDEGQKWGGFNFLPINYHIEIALPRSYDGNLKVKTSSGDISLNATYEIKKLECITQSGTVEMGEVKALDYKVKTSSGDIYIRKLEGEGSLETASGDIEIRKLKGAGEMWSSSGDIYVTYEELMGKADLSTESGEIEVRLAADFEGQIEAYTVSGDLEGNMRLNNKEQVSKSGEATFGTNPKAKLTLRTQSGDIEVNRREIEED
ncbi:hypothetical protein CS063_07970 [Sporanaerobium hydrogeniformans]|uniref:Uncharacterized protein n=1 Tax=Sporanaerobium hydrogeniformans TaxID=3072179 RepID=A0AC61DD79_9FIRM|nr:DUF4097 family beta strand repeat-containing protein [Sporanaerobium hydrogeniformans]PHV70947.1 hypothetical protein CS063_07970 [Sporanaerobium hydrogeniformans]